MYTAVVLLSCIMTTGTQAQQQEGWWHGIEREIHYKPDGEDFLLVQGNRRFNRALYGGNTGFRVEAGDLPEFALYLPGMGGNVKFGLSSGGNSKWISEAATIETRYRPGSMVYTIRDPLLQNAVLTVTVIAAYNKEALVIRIAGAGIPAGVQLYAVYGGVSGAMFSRAGDIGADPESSFYLKPEYCKGNNYNIQKNAFTLSSPPRSLSGVFPAQAQLKISSAYQQSSPQQLFSSPDTSAPVVAAKLELTNGPFYFFIENTKSTTTVYNELPQVFEQADAARKKLSDRIKVNTPDPYINTIGGALAIASDAVWEHPSFLHGAVAWRMRLNGWRGAYLADVLGWHDRAKAHFSSYALSQVTSPASGPVEMDTALHLARHAEKMGTAVFSSGYISRNPGGDKRPHHYDMNVGFIDQLLNHFLWTGDTAFIKEMWPLLKRHLAWEDRNFDTDGDHLYDAYAAIWASDALQYSGGGVTHTSAYNYKAYKMAAALAPLVGEDGTAYKKKADNIRNAINATLWMKDMGVYAEYKDLLGKQLLHPSPALWTIYHAIDSEVPDPLQAYQCLRYIDNFIPRIPIRAKGLADTTLYTISTTNWQPYTWSLNNVVLGEVMHTALAYWQGGRSEEAFQLWKSALVESMYLGASPGNFQQLSFYDAMRGELYRDFADDIGMAARSLVEGLFGIFADVLHDTLYIRTGFPAAWDHASIATPDLHFSFRGSDNADIYKVVSHFTKPLNVALRITAKRHRVQSVLVNGKRTNWRIDNAAVGMPKLLITAPLADSATIEVRWEGNEMKRIDPGKGVRTDFIIAKMWDFVYWQPVHVDKPIAEPYRKHGHFYSPAYEKVDLSSFFNDEVNNIFKQQYLSPRPPGPTMQLPTQGVGNWAYPLVLPVINDSGLRARAGAQQTITVTGGIPFATPATQGVRNVVFTSQWDNYPDSVVIPLKGNARHAYLLMAGSTNPMQSRMVNGEVIVQYRDGTGDTLALRNPENWWPIEQDYYEDGFAFTTDAPKPLRVYFKTGIDTKTFNDFISIRGFTNRGIDGGAGTMLDLVLDPAKQLKSITVKAIANDVVIGLMSVTLVR